jgi:hypothetical protein
MVRLTFGGVILLIVGAAGCRHHLALVPCDESCVPSAATCQEEHAPCPATAAAAPVPSVEVKGPQVIHVKAPQSKVEVLLPPPPAARGEAKEVCGPTCCPGLTACAPAPAPAPMAAPQQPMAYAPVTAVPQQPMAYAPVMAPGYPAPVMTSSTQTVSPKHRITLGFDTIRVPIPVLKLFATPAEQEVVTRQTFQAPAPMMAPVAPMMAPVAPMMAPVAPMMAPVAAAPAPQAAPAPAMAPQVVYAPAPQPVYAPAPQPVYAPAPQAAPAPAMAPQVVYAPAPQPVYAPAPQNVTIRGTVCVPVPPCQPACKPGCEAPAAPLPCQPGCDAGSTMLNQLNQMQDRLDAFEQSRRQQQGQPAASPQGGLIPAAAKGPAQ